LAGHYRINMLATDSELLRAYVEERSDAAFAELVQRYIGIVYHAAVRQVGGDAHRGADIAQAVFSVLAVKAGGLRNHPSLAGWLHTTTRLTALRTIRAERRRQAREAEAHMMNEISRDSGSPDWERLRPVIDEVLTELNEQDREAILLRFFADLPFADIGRRLALSENTARMRVERALEKLRVRLSRRGVTSTGAALTAVFAQQVGAAVPSGLAEIATRTALSGVLPGAAAGGIALMSMTKLAVGFTAALVLAGVVGVVKERRDYDLAEATRQQADRRFASLTREARAAEERAAAAERELTLLRRDDADARAPAPSAPAAAKTGWDPVKEGRAFLAMHPEVKQAVVEYSLAQLRFNYAPLIRQLNLSDAQADAFLNIMLDSVQQGFPIGPGGQLLLLGGGDIERISQQAERLRPIIGDEGLRQLAAYGPTSAARSLTVKLASALTFSETPLTAGQAAALVDVLQSSRPANRGAQFDWNQAMTQARTILSAPQAEAFEVVTMGDRRSAEARSDGSAQTPQRKG
jgi:RNA polymerase sigma factor (sigma-70 family)